MPVSLASGTPCITLCSLVDNGLKKLRYKSRLSELLPLAHDYSDSAHQHVRSDQPFCYLCRYTPPPPPPPRSALDAKCDDLVPTPTARSSFFNFPPSSCFRYAVPAEFACLVRQTLMICQYEGSIFRTVRIRLCHLRVCMQKLCDCLVDIH